MKDPDTRPRKILSENVRALMGQRPALDTIKKIVKASDGKLSNGKVGRITSASHVTDIDALADLAELFEVEPWQLLVPNLDPAAPPVVASAEIISALVLSTLQAVQQDDKTRKGEAKVRDQTVDKTAELGNLGRGLTSALITEGKGNARRQSGQVQKPRTHRSVKRST